jgi:lycopene beta-cyclase
MRPDVDLLILGGGCAGLSLGMRLAALNEGCPHTLILERRTHYTHDRTWCFWGEARITSQPWVQHRWERMRLKLGAETLTIPCGDTPYHMLPSQHFYAGAMQVIEASSQVDLQLGSAITAMPQKREGIWHVQTTNGTVRAARIIDTRPPTQASAGDATLWQSFCGMEVETSVDCFDPTQIDLMHFAPPHPSFVAFTYVLPTSPRRALIEVTRFAIQPFGPDDLAEILADEVVRYTLGVPYSTLHHEHGILPMGSRHRKLPRDPSYLQVGLHAGAARPSTGYAFQRIQRWAEACAAQLGKGAAPVGHMPDPLLRRAMDHLFLQVIRADTNTAPELFMALFRQVEPERMIRFLSDQATLSDYIAIIRALPAGLFLREIPQALRSRLMPYRAELPA